jgi:hypothetical protein
MRDRLSPRGDGLNLLIIFKLMIKMLQGFFFGLLLTEDHPTEGSVIL